jgi:hypothetical protein
VSKHEAPTGLVHNIGKIELPTHLANGLESKRKPIEIIMACKAGRISIGEWS